MERLRVLEPDKIASNGNSSITPEAVGAAIFRAVDTLNGTLAKTQQVGKSGDTVLIDSKGSLDSMALVNLIVFVEDELAQAFGRQLDLTGGDPFEEQDLKTLGSMTRALCRKLAA
jgi:acyl carrier protein